MANDNRTGAGEAISRPRQPFGHVATADALSALKRVESELLPPSNIGNKHVDAVAWDQVDIHSVLGEGAFSFVFEVSVDTTKNERPNDFKVGRCSPANRSERTYALKCLKVKAISNVQSFVTSATDLATEACLLAQLDHEHIISLSGVCKGSVSQSYSPTDGYGNDGGMGYFILLEDVLEETLFDRLAYWRNEAGNNSGLWSQMLSNPLSCSHAAKEKMVTRMDTVALSVASAMKYLHRKGIVYRDLKPQNIGFSNGIVKLFDFGLARDISACRQDDVAGSICYLAPEIIRGEGTFLSSDVYSFAIVLWELCTVQIPYERYTSPDELAQKVAFHHVRPSAKGGVSHIPSRTLRNLIWACWSSCPADRPTFSEIHNTLLRISNKVRISGISADAMHKDTMASVVTDDEE